MLIDHKEAKTITRHNNVQRIERVAAWEEHFRINLLHGVEITTLLFAFRSADSSFYRQRKCILVNWSVFYCRRLFDWWNHSSGEITYCTRTCRGSSTYCDITWDLQLITNSTELPVCRTTHTRIISYVRVSTSESAQTWAGYSDRINSNRLRSILKESSTCWTCILN